MSLMINKRIEIADMRDTYTNKTLSEVKSVSERVRENGQRTIYDRVETKNGKVTRSCFIFKSNGVYSLVVNRRTIVTTNDFTKLLRSGQEKGCLSYEDLKRMSEKLKAMEKGVR